MCVYFGIVFVKLIGLRFDLSGKGRNAWVWDSLFLHNSFSIIYVSFILIQGLYNLVFFYFSR